MKSHVKKNHNERCFKCQFCGKDWETNYSMERHINQVHNVEKAFRDNNSV